MTDQVQRPRAWRLAFKPPSEAGSDEQIRLDLPDPTVASFEEIADPGRLLLGAQDEFGPRIDPGYREIVFLPAGSATPYAMQKAAEAWVGDIGSGADASHSFVEIVLQGVRVLRAEGRIVVIGNEDRRVRRGLAQFEWLNDQLRKLEARIAGWWMPIEEDIKSLYANSAKALSRPAREIATQVTLARNWLVRAESVLDRPDLTAPPLARRIFLELSLRSEVTARLRAAERAIESMTAFCEHAFSQANERRDARRSLIIELGILLAILVEIALQLWEMWR